MKRIDELKLGVYGIVIRDGAVLVIKKARGPYTGLYDLPGGGMELDESIDQGLAREFIEETGLIVVGKKLVTVNDAHNIWTEGELEYHSHHVGIYYRVDVRQGDLKTDADGLDSLGALFVSADDLNSANTAGIALSAIRAALDSNNS